MSEIKGTLTEPWIPLPERLVDDVLTAPNEKRRLWAVAYLLMWVIAFLRAKRERPASLSDLKSWSASTTQKRAIAAREDALNCLSDWNPQKKGTKTGLEGDQKGTGKGPERDWKGTGETEDEAANSLASGLEGDQKETERGPEGDQKGTARGRAVRKTQNRDSKGTAYDLLSVWNDLETHRLGLQGSGSRSWSLTKPRQRLLKARLGDGLSLDDLREVWTWWHQASHPRAVFLRENGHTVDTVLRHAAEYLELAGQPGRRAANHSRSVEAEAEEAEAAWGRIEENYRGF
jgi:hypothetical protein